MKQIAVSSSPVIILKFLEPTDIYFYFLHFVIYEVQEKLPSPSIKVVQSIREFLWVQIQIWHR